MKKKYDVCIIGGLGHVGLPLGLSFADKGQNVILYDLHQESIDKVSKGEMPFIEEGADPVLKRVLGKNLFVSSQKDVIRESRYVIIVIGTPADKHMNPEFTKFKKLLDEIIDYISDDAHIILRSTVFPGTQNKIKIYLKQKGKKTKVTFCPERIAQGRSMEELHKLPQIIGADTPEELEDAKKLFSVLADTIIPLSPLEAELAKLFTNVWRYLEFAIANQFYQISVSNNADFYRIYNAVTTQYPRAASYKSAGFAAGPCLFKDTAHLIAYTGNEFFLGSAAVLANEGLPNFIVQRLKLKYTLQDLTVGILGMAFKANIDDKRDSLSYKLRKILEAESKLVLCSDPYVKSEDFVSPEQLVRDCDIIILGTPHSLYKNLPIPENKVLVDIWNFFGKGGLF